ASGSRQVDVAAGQQHGLTGAVVEDATDAPGGHATRDGFLENDHIRMAAVGIARLFVGVVGRKADGAVAGHVGARDVVARPAIDGKRGASALAGWLVDGASK